MFQFEMVSCLICCREVKAMWFNHHLRDHRKKEDRLLPETSEQSPARSGERRNHKRKAALL